jgi:HEAT repeat protein
MRKGPQIVLAVLLVAVLTVLGWQAFRLREPVYKGKALSGWLETLTQERLRGNYNESSADPIRQIGTNALPVLIEILRAHDTPFKQVLMAWAQKQTLVHFHFRSADQRRPDAVYGYEVLGSLASAQVPVLIDCLTNDRSPKVRMAAASALGSIGPKARVAGPALFRAAKDTDGLVRNNALWALSQILPDPQLTMPVLIAGLDDAHPVARENAAIGLAKYGQEAKAAVPALLRTLATNRSAGWALKKIDLEAAAQAGVK